MDFDNYQESTAKTAIYPRIRGRGIEYCTLGLANEAGEAAGVLKKYYRDVTPEEEFKEKMKKELGDVLWYVSQLCSELNLRLADVAQANLDKLQDRQSRGVLGGSGDDR